MCKVQYKRYFGKSKRFVTLNNLIVNSMNFLFSALVKVLIAFKTNVLTFSDNMDIDND